MENIIERAMGEEFELDGITLRVVSDEQSEGTYRCDRCVLNVTSSIRRCTSSKVRAVVGRCNKWRRKDGMDVQFVYAKYDKGNNSNDNKSTEK